MENFWSFDEVVFDCTSRKEAMQVFRAIQEDELAAVEQIGGGHDVVTPMLLEGNPCEANSSIGSERNLPRLEGDVTLPNSINVDDCVEFLMIFLEQHAVESPCHNKNRTKKMLLKIAKEMQVLPPRNHSIIKNDDEDIMSNWKSYVEALIKELRIVQSRGFNVCNSGVYVLTNTPYALILEMVAEMVVG